MLALSNKLIKKIIHSVIFILCFGLHFVFCQTSIEKFNKLNINGTPFNQNVNVLFEDSIGYLWIGTNNGLFRYDGNNLLQYQYDVFDPNSIPNNSINSIVEDKYNNLWIGCESFLIFFNRKENKFKGFYKNVTSVVLQKDKNDNIWSNARNTGLILIEPNEDIDKIKLDSHFNYLSSNIVKFDRQINSFFQDNFNRHWLGTPKGIFVFDANKKYIKTNFNEPVIAIKPFNNNQFLALTNKHVYILGYNKADYKLEFLEQYTGIIDTSENTTFTAVAIDKNNDLWIGSTHGLIKGTRTNKSYRFNSNEDYLSNEKINSLVFDSYNNLWIGSLKGIYKHLGRTSIFDYVNVNSEKNVINAETNSILNYNDNILLMGMDNGLFKYNLNKNVASKIELPINNVDRISFNYNKTKLLIASDTIFYESENFELGKQDLKLTEIKSYNRSVYDIEVINKNEICIGIWGKGIDIINTENNISPFKKKLIEILDESHTSVLKLSSKNILWIGTRGEGLFRVDFNNESYEQFLPRKEGGLTSNAILSIHEDSNKNIWIGTRGGGLNKYIESTNSFMNFEKSNKLIAKKVIAAIQEDRKGNLWMSTEQGLIRFEATTEKFNFFGVEDGIETSKFIFNSSASTENNLNLYFGSNNGFYTIKTNLFSQQKIIPSTVITDFYTLGPSKNSNASNKENTINSLNVNSETTIALPYNQNNIVVSFSSLDLTSPSKNQYAYKLEGLNDFWIYTNASNRNANYNDLPPGTYIFMVKSSNSDGVWNETPTKLSFQINPPIWKSKWAILGYWVLFFIIIYTSFLLIRRWYRLKKNLVKETISREKDNEHNKMKMIFFTDISHELRTPLTLILGTIEKIVKDRKFTLSPLTAQRIYNNSLRMNRLINQIMDIRKFDVGEFKIQVSKNNIITDIKKIKNAFNDFAKMHQIRYEFVSCEKSLEAWYDVEIIEKILFNLLSNAFKFTPEKGHITIAVDKVSSDEIALKKVKLKSGTYVKCSVRDSGIGIPQKDLEFIFDRYYQSTKLPTNQVPGTGIGMELVQKLVERHHGTITVESEENKYTEFIFFIPVEKSQYKKKEISEKDNKTTKSIIENSEFSFIEEISTLNTINDTNKNSKPSILLVEDNVEVRTMIKEELTNSFYVLEASNGEEGYDLIVKEKPQLIISDILMPIEDGVSMLKRVKANPETSDIPIFMLTAKGAQETKIECLSLGAADYIEKPFSLEFVKWKVKNTLLTRKELKEKYSKVITAEPSEIHVDSNDEKFIKKLVKIIEDSMDDNLLSVEYLASEVGMSRANLYRKVQAILNDTPVNFIKTIRLKRAAQLLKNNDLYLSEIAYMTGFNNQKYFGKCFAKQYGMSPTEYIKKHANAGNIITIDTD
ncbi:hybrid sensor histidine kinase/response regulator transcription factor [Snuella sedimenti]|uniref:histidine kinase n=1 Tax=Snuella sedimenti TaxID=2798802 RepID=A0A8J7ISC8_9FLAO|nr:two-component regulator propeller domain-containing protein [Snuella sedimenti]MBJ6367010.1 response regulator [Snuella sedimenti]